MNEIKQQGLGEKGRIDKIKAFYHSLKKIKKKLSAFVKLYGLDDDKDTILNSLFSKLDFLNKKMTSLLPDDVNLPCFINSSLGTKDLKKELEGLEPENIPKHVDDASKLIIDDLKENGVYSDIFKNEDSKKILVNILKVLIEKSCQYTVVSSKEKKAARKNLLALLDVLVDFPKSKGDEKTLSKAGVLLIKEKFEDVELQDEKSLLVIKNALEEVLLDSKKCLVAAIDTFDLKDPDTKEIYDHMKEAHDVIKDSKADVGLSKGLKEAGSKFLSSVSEPKDTKKANEFKKCLDGLKSKTANKAKKSWVKKLCSFVKDKFLTLMGKKSKNYQARKVKEYANLAGKLAERSRASIVTLFDSKQKERGKTGQLKRGSSYRYD